uniref:Uncharacterized protein n=1 Tax=Arundo donax TaxID=35708 RepID=A0A0A9HHY8_ARUDO
MQQSKNLLRNNKTKDLALAQVLLASLTARNIKSLTLQA